MTERLKGVSGLKGKIEKGKLARCPYCGRIVNYFFLYDSKRYDFGHCSHCGGIYAVRYSGWGLGLTFAALVCLVCGVLLRMLADGNLPSPRFFLLFAGIFLIIYWLIPVFILPTKCIVDGKLGGFPEADAVPAAPQRKKRAARRQEATNKNTHGRRNLIVAVEDDWVEEPTIVAGKADVDAQLSAQERFQRAEKNREAARRER